MAVRTAFLNSYSLLLLLLAWELAGFFGLVRPLFLPTIGSVFIKFWSLLGEGDLIGPLSVSLFRAFAGLFLAALGGIAIGLLMARSKLAHWMLDMLVSLAFPAPKIAFVPIFIFWFGIDHLSKILLVFFTCIFPMIVGTYHGALTVNRNIIWSAEAMGTPEHKLLSRIILPASLPYIFNALRVTVPVALITAFTAEMIAGGGGIGSMLMFAQRFFESPTVFVYILVMLMTGFIFDLCLLRLRRTLIPWQDESESS